MKARDSKPGGRAASRRKSHASARDANDGREISRAHSSILDAAVLLFGEQGYTGTTMRDIAKAVEVLPGSLYAHIKSKETLLVDIVDAGIKSFFSAVEPEATRHSSARARMAAAIKAHIAVVAEHPQRSLVVFHQWRYLRDENLQAAIQKRRSYEKIFRRIVEDGIKSGEFNPALSLRITVLTILGALNWTPEWYSPKGSASPEELGDMIADTLLGGILKSARHGS